MEIAVIGGGAAGMMAACMAARPGVRVSLFEGGELPGKKILATGNGRCNLTNLNMDPSCFRSNQPDAAAICLNRYSPEKVLELFRTLGVLCYDRDGYVYPLSNQASSVRNALYNAMIERGVKVHNHSVVTGIQYNPPKAPEPYGSFTLLTHGGYSIYADTVILACGGAAMPSSGSDGSGYALAKKLGHRIIPATPALTYIKCADFPASLHGVRVHGRVTVTMEDGHNYSETGELQLTRAGVSGIPAFQVSRYVSRALQQDKTVKVVLDLSVDPDGRSLSDLLQSLRSAGASVTVTNAVRGIYPEKLAVYLLEKMKVNASTRLDALTQDELDQMESVAAAIGFCAVGTGSFEEAQVTSGGVSLSEIDPETMQSNRVRGLYFAGEILDVDGACGGYNLHWAWSSAHTAGTSARIRSERIGCFEKVPYQGPVHVQTEPKGQKKKKQERRK